GSADPAPRTPRTHLRGLIEASAPAMGPRIPRRGLRGLTSAASLKPAPRGLVFLRSGPTPRTHLRGLIEACPIRASVRRRRTGTPRTHLRGLIEAPSVLWRSTNTHVTPREVTP